MALGRIISSVAACAAVAGCAVAAVAMVRHDKQPVAQHTSVAPSPTRTYRPAHPPIAASSTPSAQASATEVRVAPSTSASRKRVAAAPSSTVQTTEPAAPLVTTHAAPRTSVPPAVPHTTTHAPAPRRTTAHPAPRPAGSALPLSYSTGSATRVITVVGRSHSSTTATLQAWTKTAGGWTKWGPAIYAHVGSDGLGGASEYRSATPTGSFGLTQAFGYYSDPGTALPYFKTTWADWWISTSGSKYNTHQRCSSCGYGSPDEHLVTETPFYNYAVVIDTPSGASAYPKGSAFFLHVTDGNATAGCVAISQSNLVSILRWLTPSAHPRILIGVA